MNKNTYLPLILTEVGYGKQTEHISGGLSDTFQTTGRQGDFRPNHRRVMCNYSKKKMTSIWKLRGWVTSFGTFWLIKMPLSLKLKEIKYILAKKKILKLKLKKKKTWKIEDIKKNKKNKTALYRNSSSPAL